MRVVCKHVSHLFEAEMIVDILKQAGIVGEISVLNGPENMDQYLGHNNKGVDVLVEEEVLSEALEFLDNSHIEEIEDQTTSEVPKPMPLLFIGVFVIVMVLFYMVYLK